MMVESPPFCIVTAAYVENQGMSRELFPIARAHNGDRWECNREQRACKHVIAVEWATMRRGAAKFYRQLTSHKTRVR